MTKFCDRQEIGTKGFSPEFIESLGLYDWPGNVRELSNTILSVLSEAGNDPIQFLDRTGGGINIGRAKPGTQQMCPTENVQRQITVMPVVPMKESSRLMPVDRIIRGIQVQDDPARGTIIRVQKYVCKKVIDPVAVDGDLRVSTVLAG